MYLRQSRNDPFPIPLSGFGESITADDPTGTIRCTANERRIHPIVEARPDDLVAVDRRYLANPRGRVLLDRSCYASYTQLKAAAEAAGIGANVLTVASGFRSIADQRALYERAIREHGAADARNWVAPPGNSAHHTGRAIDLNLGYPLVARMVAPQRLTAAYRWLVCNAARFGFTPYAREPWHWEFHPPGNATLGEPVPAPAPGMRPAPPPPPPPRARPRPPVAPAPPGPAPTPGPTAWEEKAFRITGEFEGGFGGVSGNFDGQGMSLGFLQWNIGTGSLLPLLQAFIAQEPAAFASILGAAESQQIRILLARPRSEQVAFFDGISSPPSKARLVEPWQTRFRRLALHPSFLAIQMRNAQTKVRSAYRLMRQFGFNTERAFVAMFDACVQHGDAWLSRSNRQSLITREFAANPAASTQQKLAIIARILGQTAASRWRCHVYCRRMTIAFGTLPATVDCSVLGVSDNARQVCRRYASMDLGRQFGLGDQVIAVPANP